MKIPAKYSMILCNTYSTIEANKIRRYLSISFIIIIILITLSTIISFKYLSSVQNHIINIIGTQNKQIDLMHKLRSISRERIIILQALTNATDSFKKDAYIQHFHSLGGLFLEIRQELLKTQLNEDEKKLLKIQREIARNVVSSQYNVIELVENNDNGKALNLLLNETVPMQNQNISYIDQFIVYQNHENQFIKSESEKKLKTSYYIVATLTVLSILLIIIVAVIVTRHTSRIINLLATLAEKHKNTALQLCLTHDSLEQEVKEKNQELQKANEHLKHIAGHDTLTELPNRRLFSELLKQELNRAKRNQYMLALLYMDLDGFKLINDQYGHDIGDEVLINVTKRLQTSLRKEDLIARLGDNEFAICYSNIKNIDNVKALCKVLLDKTGQPINIQGKICHVGLSIGVSVFPEHGDNAQTLLKIADAAMYQVKKRGKNSFQIGSVEID